MLKINSYEEALKLLQSGEGRPGRIHDNFVVVEIIPAGEKCHDGGEYGVSIVFTPEGWFWENTIDGFYCRLDGSQLHFTQNPCRDCCSLGDCEENGFLNPYPCE